ncbi:MAG: glycosyltransferase [Phycisphaerales bacterium]|nr:glycosyltransferase [Phycisphaerales bacterium]
MKRESVSIVVPVYNEAGCLDELVNRCLDSARSLDRRFELVLVDDGSRDGSTEMLVDFAAEHPGEVMAVILNRNYGQHSAIMCGFAQSSGDIVITLDADLQNPPEEIPRLVAAIDDGNDVVGTVRQDRRDSSFRRLASWMINRVVKKTTGVMMHDYGCMLRAYRRSVVNAMLQCRERSTFIPVLANSFAKRTCEIPVKHAERAVGDSKYSIFKLVNLQFDLLTSMTTTPLRLLTYIGAGISFLGIGFGIALLILRIILGDEWGEQGIFTLFAVLFVFVGAQFMAMGLLGEYIGRIYHDVRDRPRYFIDRVVGECPTLSESESVVKGSTLSDTVVSS